MTTSTLDLTKALIQRKSITPDDGGSLALIETQLTAAGFTIEYLHDGDVKNLFATIGTQGPLFIFLGHVDVVPPGPEDQWNHPPFEPYEEAGLLYGRGSADMKSAVAAMVWALIKFAPQHQAHNIRVGLLLTSDEEGVAIHGVRHVMKIFSERSTHIDYCLVGEPSCDKVFGDTIKIGRRGTLSATLTIYGKQGHIAYPHLADNPIHRFAKAWSELSCTEWDQGNEYFQPTSFQCSNIHAGTSANNIIPGTLTLDCNFRFATSSTAEQLQERFETILQKHQLNYKIDWHLGGLPFLTAGGRLLATTQNSVQQHTGVKPICSTQGGTSDGRFIAPTGAEVLEFGVCNHSIHQIDEHVRIEEIELLAQIYLTILENI